MYLGFVLIGVATGIGSGAAALMLGHPFWVALLLYAGVGMLGTTLLTLACLLPNLLPRAGGHLNVPKVAG